MNPVLSRLGVPPEIQAFFKAGELQFNYGGDVEQFDPDFHRVPCTRHLFIAGTEISHELILTSSVMEAIAFLTFYSHQYSRLDNLTVIALGNHPQQGQLRYINAGWQKRKITMVFGKDISGVLTDIRVATGVRGKNVRLVLSGQMIDIEHNHIHYRFDPDKLSLSKFEIAAALRSGIRTCKPKQFNTFLDQLLYDAQQ